MLAATAASGQPSFVVDEPPRPALVRSPVTLARLAILAAGAVFAASRLSRARQANFRTQLADLMSGAPRWLMSLTVSAFQLGALVPAGLGIVVLLLTRRTRRLGRILVAALLTTGGLYVVSQLVGPGVFRLVTRRQPRGANRLGVLSGYGIGSSFPTTLDLAVITAGFIVDAEFWRPRWRRWRWVVVGCLVLARLGASLAHPATIAASLLVAGAAVHATRALLGMRNDRPGGVDVGQAVAANGYQVTSVSHAPGSTRLTAYVVQTTAGRMYAKVEHRDRWAAFLPARVYQTLRFRDATGQHPFRSLRTSIEHEALCALKARSDGVPTPRLAVVTELHGGGYLLAFDSEGYTPIAQLAPAQRRPELLDQVWSAVKTMRDHHIVHRRLNGAAVLVDAGGQVAVAQWADAVLGAGDELMGADVAELLATSAASIGPEAAVDAAVRGVGPQAVAGALARLQPLALTRSTRAAVRRTEVLDPLRAEVQRVTGVEDVDIAPIQRIAPRTLVMIGALVLAGWTLIPQLAGAGSMWRAVVDADWWWVAAAVGLSAVTYIGATFSFAGSVNERVAFLPNMACQIASSFVGTVAPGGTLALWGRFLRRRGVTAEGTAAAVSINLVAGAVVHATLIGLFLALAGASGLEAFNLPSPVILAVIVAAVVLTVVVGAMIPRTRTILAVNVWPPIRRSLDAVGGVLRDPAKVIQLLGGSVVVTMGYATALAAAVGAFGTGPAFSSITLVYLVAGIVSTVTPTPGGLGAVEATLIAGLTSAGMPGANAIAAVLLFRLATFWLPLLPGWLSFTALQRHGDV